MLASLQCSGPTNKTIGKAHGRDESRDYGSTGYCAMMETNVWLAELLGRAVVLSPGGTSWFQGWIKRA